ncbi:MAG TPA: POTRA domain-containing protein [Ignavibacteria bacterium]|nr:POTRA domain-containing protein [Ignavibacteria bacterium]
MHGKFLILFLLLLPSISFSQTIIEKIEIEGNSFFDDDEVLNYFVSKKNGVLNTTQLQADLKTLRTVYKNNGFLFVDISSPEIIYTSDSAYADVKILINENENVKIGEIIFSGNKAISEEKLLTSIETKKNDILDNSVLNQDLVSILKLYETSGYPFVKANIEDISVYEQGDKNFISIKISIQENIKLKINEIKISGNELTKKNVIDREIRINNDSTVTIETLENIKFRLERLGIFSAVSFPKVYVNKSSKKTGLLIEVKEGNANTFDGILGYVPPANESESGYLTGLVNLSFKNIFGTARRLDLKYQQEVRETQELEFRYLEPYFLSFPFNINFDFLQRIQDSTYTRRRINFKADYNLTDNFTLSALGGYDRIIPSDDSLNTFVIADSRLFSSGLELKYDSRNNIYFPTSGILYKTFYSIGDKKIFNIEKLNNLGFKDEYVIQIYTGELEFYYSVFKQSSVLLKLFGGEVKGDKLEESDLFRIGGNRNIRGYRQEQFLASRLAYLNFEPRLFLTGRSFAFAFYDAGYYFRPQDEINNISEQKGFLFGYGIGLRLETDLGLIGVSYALGKGDSFLDGKINFGIITDF